MAKTGEKKPSGMVSALFDFADSIVVALIVVISLFTFVFMKATVSGESMTNTLHDGDQLIVSDFNYTPQIGDIVIISRNYNNTADKNEYYDDPLVKRVIATAGQSVEIKDGDVYVDDKKINEPYLDDTLTFGETPNREFEGKQTVPDGCIFVMGDNRQNSKDSRSKEIGFVRTRYVLGKVLWRIYPFDDVTSFIE